MVIVALSVNNELAPSATFDRTPRTALAPRPCDAMLRRAMTPRLASLLALPAVALAVAGCGSDRPTPPAEGSAKPAADAPLAPGDAAPSATLLLQDGKKVELASLKGKQVLVYFYPKDDTPGCTVEAKGLRDAWADLQAAGVEVYGVSMQDAKSHDAFIDKYDLPFPLVVDEQGEVARAFRVPVKGSYASRQSFLLGTDGKVKKVWLEVDPSKHADEVLAAAKS
jgi:peroxiredoxin Q/BCP